jgi:outer membrane protein TolC
MFKRNATLVLILVIYLVFISGCTNFNSKEIRREHVQSFSSDMLQKTHEILDNNQPLDLNDCIRIAMQNSLTLKEAEIKQKLALLKKNVSFANFLPAVSLNYDKTWFDPQPQIKFGTTGLPMQDKDVTEITWNIQLSIFNPATWFMYSMYTHGYEISKLVTEYTQQALALQITVQYYQCLSIEKTLSVIENQLDAAKAFQKEIQAFGTEGLVNIWKVEQVNALVLSRQIQLENARKSLRQAKTELLVNMGLYPLNDVTLESRIERTRRLSGKFNYRCPAEQSEYGYFRQASRN